MKKALIEALSNLKNSAGGSKPLHMPVLDRLLEVCAEVFRLLFLKFISLFVAVFCYQITWAVLLLLSIFAKYI